MQQTHTKNMHKAAIMDIFSFNKLDCSFTSGQLACWSVCRSALSYQITYISNKELLRTNQGIRLFSHAVRVSDGLFSLRGDVH